MDMADMYSEKPVLDEMERYEETRLDSRPILKKRLSPLSPS